MSNGELFDSGEIDKLDAAKVLAHMNNPMVLKRWEGTLTEMASLAEIKLREMLPDQLGQVPQLARAVVFAICETMGGSVVYIPRGDTLRKALRDAEIFRAWRKTTRAPTSLPASSILPARPFMTSLRANVSCIDEQSRICSAMKNIPATALTIPKAPP
ncbi:transcriptional regulator [Pseudomonas qingdaonensis]|nr:transcriptional regulator [Pseudomonas qingdaonensis]